MNRYCRFMSGFFPVFGRADILRRTGFYPAGIFREHRLAVVDRRPQRAEFPFVFRLHLVQVPAVMQIIGKRPYLHAEFLKLLYGEIKIQCHIDNNDDFSW